jgi:hypothetical protein
MKPEHTSNRRLTLLAWLFVAPFIVAFLGLALALVGLMARQHESSSPWGVWCSIIGWSLAIGGVALRPLARRWEKRWRQ